MTQADSNKFPLIMGIVNLTPDSFSDGGKINSIKNGVDYCLKLIDDGADILDLGGESTRPGSEPVSLESEINRVIPIMREVKKINPNIKISVDTTKYEVASQALDLGADYLNDISGLRFDQRLADLAANFNVPLILMHSRENPKTMQELPLYNNLISELKNELQSSIDIAVSKGVKKIIIDPGIGFAKNFEHNIEILKNLDKLYELNYPILLGISRKSFIGKIFKEPIPEKRDFGTAILHALLLKFRIDYLRVHNVEIINQLKILYNLLNF